jgi:hypothetical protein
MMAVTTGLSGNEIYCLNLKGFTPGNIVVGNSVHALGFLGSVGSGVRAFVGGEIAQVTSLMNPGSCRRRRLFMIGILSMIHLPWESGWVLIRVQNRLIKDHLLAL